jgi:hypothetical protein
MAKLSLEVVEMCDDHPSFPTENHAWIIVKDDIGNELEIRADLNENPECDTRVHLSLNRKENTPITEENTKVVHLRESDPNPYHPEYEREMWS